MMTFKECISKLKTLFPVKLAEDWDNVGLLVDSRRPEVKKILLTLSVDEKVIREAIEDGVDLIVSHHPLFFQLKGIDYGSREGALLGKLLREDIGLYVMHTNFDNHHEGLNWYLGKLLGLKEMEVFIPGGNGGLVKLEFYVPQENEGEVLKPLYNAGGGKLGNYDSCSFTMKGFGSFRPLEGSDPYIGSEGKKEIVEEIKVEMIFPKEKIEEGIKVLKAHHPYETVAYQILPCIGRDSMNGLGVVGNLEKPVMVKNYLKEVAGKLGKPFIEITKGCGEKMIERVAIAGGSGKSFLGKAMSVSDLYLTGDLTYHDFELAEYHSFPLGDIGHFEGEKAALREFCGKLEDVLGVAVKLSEEDSHRERIDG